MATTTPLLPQLLGGRFRTTGKLMGIALAVLSFTPEMKFRVRSAADAFGGGADLQVLFELALWGAFGGWALLQVVRGINTGRFSFGRLGPGMNIVLTFWLLATATGVLALSIRSMVRSFQLTMLITSLLLLYWESRRDRQFFLDAWVWFRRTFVGVVLSSMVISAILNFLFEVWPTHIDVDGFSRYRFFYVHPISVGGMSGVALVLLLGMLIGKRDLPPRMWMRGAMWLGTAMLFAGIIGTRSRGSLAGILAAVGVLIVLSNHRRIKVLAFSGGFLLLFGLIGYAATPAGSEAFTRIITRGQTTEQLASLSQRTDLFAIAGQLFVDRPIFGYGYFMPGPIFSNYFEWAGHGHNIFVEMAVAMGAAGILVLLAIMIVPAVNVVRAARSRAPSPMRVLVPEMAAIYVLMQAMGVIGPGISGSVAYEATGFLVFAAYSDLFLADTRWSGLRRRPQKWQRPDPIPVPDPIDVELEQMLADATPAPPVEPEPIPVQEVDNLQLIRGIGPKVEAALYRAGITTFDHLAEKTPSQLSALMRHSGLRLLRIKPDNWPHDARMAMLARDSRQESGLE